MTLRTQSAFTAPVKYPALSLVTLTVGHLTHPRICLSLPFGLQDRQKALDTLPQETYEAIIAAISASDLSAAFQDKDHVYTADDQSCVLPPWSLHVRPGPTWW